jgi:hypothetical protein
VTYRKIKSPQLGSGDDIRGDLLFKHLAAIGNAYLLLQAPCNCRIN